METLFKTKKKLDEIKEMNVYYLSLTIYFLLLSRLSGRCLSKVMLPFFLNKIGSPVFDKKLPLSDMTFNIKNILSFKVNQLFLTNRTKKRIILCRMECRKKPININTLITLQVNIRGIRYLFSGD